LYFRKNRNLLSIGHAFIELGSVDSTNNYAMARASEGSVHHGTLFFAHDQWAGKGQRGRTWTSTPGENIILSAVLEPVALVSSQAFALSACVALACHDLFSRYAGTEATRIKWPNDLYWGDRKAGGILIENSFRGDRWTFAIAGMGININQTEFAALAARSSGRPEGSVRDPVSLRQITGQSHDPVELARELGVCLDRRYGELEGTSTGGTSARGIPGLLAQYNDRLYRRGQQARLRKDNAVFDTVITGVSADGRLLTKDVLEREFSFGEVEWVI
jgi:BirA family transcriptional regulator, biotin operon repressor / biotin---[acetyl-CoA-carboxylase] ligase